MPAALTWHKKGKKIFTESFRTLSKNCFVEKCGMALAESEAFVQAKRRRVEHIL
jgi:hypothetical protein